MRKKDVLIRLSAFALAILLMTSMMCLTAYAAPDGGDDGGAIADSGEAGAGDAGDADTGDGSGISDTPADTPVDTPADTPADDGGDTPADTPADNGDGGNGYEEYLNSLADDDSGSDYEAPENLDELPTLAPAEMQPATAVVLPDVEVSDASLLSGVIMWLCVAVGIAVVVGVMVSKRTRRRGT